MELIFTVVGLCRLAVGMNNHARRYVHGEDITQKNKLRNMKQLGTVASTISPHV